jgi:S1-C subfamily serine protease
MKQARWIWIVAIAVALTAPALAGGKDHPCTAGTQDCLNKMVAKLQHKGWVGIEYDKKDHGATPVVKKVVPGSPAEKAGLHKGDVLLAVNGVKYGEEDKTKWKKVKQAWTPGSTITYLVARDGKKKEVDVTLGKVPEEVLAAWVGEHMLQHATVEVASN